MSKNQRFEKSRLYCAYNATNTWRITYYFSTYHIGNHQAKVIRVSPATALNSNRNMSQWHVIIAETDLSTKKSTLCTNFTLKLHTCYEVVFCDSASRDFKLFLRNIEFCYKVVTSGITNTYMYSLHTVWNSLSLSGNEIHS